MVPESSRVYGCSVAFQWQAARRSTDAYGTGKNIGFRWNADCYHHASMSGSWVETTVDRSVPVKVTLPVPAVAPPPFGTETLCSVPVTEGRTPPRLPTGWSGLIDLTQPKIICVALCCLAGRIDGGDRLDHMGRESMEVLSSP